MTRIAPLLTWRGSVCESDLQPTTRHVALTLSLHMSERGDSAFPGPTLLSHETGLSLRCVKEHLGILVEKGWLVVVERGGIKGDTRRANKYRAAIPMREVTAPVQERTRAAALPVQERASTRAANRATPVQQVHPNSKRELSIELSTGAAAPQGKTEAHRITEEHWAASKPRPVLRGGFVALRGIVQTLIDAGHDRDAILTALGSTRAYTLDAIQFSLRERERRPQSGHDRTMEMLGRLAGDP